MSNTRYLFFSGKGGVGKTTMACATAVHWAERGLRTLIITTDPASNLADVFETQIGHHIRPLGIDNLWGMEIDPDRATEEYRDRVLAPMRAVMPQSVLAVMEEQFRSPCTTEIASFDRFVDFMTEDTGHDGFPYNIVIFDTAPTGHTVRLLELPVDWSKHIEQSARGSGNTCIGPVTSIQENKKKYDAATALLGDPSRTDFVFVLQPEETSLYETKRSQAELETIGVKGVQFIVNGILPRAVCNDAFFRTRREMQQRYLSRIRRELSGPMRFMHLQDGEIAGIRALSDVAQELFAADETSTERGSIAHRSVSGAGPFALGRFATAVGITVASQAPGTAEGRTLADAPPVLPAPASLADLIRPAPGKTKAVYFTGKGGVGKTVVSSAVAYALASRGHKTLLLTTDPTSHIEQVFEQPFDYSQQVGMMVSTTGESAEVKSATQERFDRIIRRMKDPEQSIFAFVVYPESTRSSS